MSGFEIIGVVLGVYPMVTHSLALYKAAKSGSGWQSLQLEFATEKMIYKEFVLNILSSDVSQSDLLQLSNSDKPSLGLWKDRALHAKLGKRLGDEKSKLVLETLNEVNILLASLKEKLISNHTESVRSPLVKYQTSKADMSSTGSSAWKAANGYPQYQA
jgi:hypothetical protein